MSSELKNKQAKLVRKKIKSFTDLLPWKKAHQLALHIYQETTGFTKEEKYSLTSQVRRAGISVTPNIAEGFARKSYKEKLYFYYTALGSITEIQNQLLLARDLGYLKDKQLGELGEETIETQKLLNFLIKSTKKKAYNS